MVVTTLTSAAAALHDEEVERTRTYLRAAWAVAAGTAVAVAVVPGEPRLARAILAILAVGVAGSVGLYRELRSPSRYHPGRLGVLAFAAIACGQLGILYVGVFSAAPLVVGLGVFFFCRTEDRGSAIAVYLTAALAHAAIAGLVISGAIRDPGFYPVRADCSITAQVVGQLIIQQGYAICFALARTTRRSSLRAIEELQRATRLAAQRDAQVAELRGDLDRALAIGGPGQLSGHVVGTWELGALLGRGAMGEVYAATELGGDAEAAVKVLRRELLGDPDHHERFLREVQIASAIDSPHVVRVLGASAPRDPLPYLAMERLRGRTLGELLRAGPLPGPALHALVHQVAEVLDRARAAGVVHRDLKPHNLFLAGGLLSQVKIIDFGIARSSRATHEL